MYGGRGKHGGEDHGAVDTEQVGSRWRHTRDQGDSSTYECEEEWPKPDTQMFFKKPDIR